MQLLVSFNIIQTKMMKEGLSVLLVLICSSGFSQNWQPVECSDLPLEFDCQNSTTSIRNWADTINPIEDSTLFSVDSLGLWQYANSYKPEFDSISAFRGWVTDSINSYGLGKKSWFEMRFSAEFSCTWVIFEHNFSSDSALDAGYVQFSCDGENWQTLDANEFNTWIPEGVNYFNYVGMPWDAHSFIHDTIPAFSGNSNGWEFSGFQLCWYYPRFQGTQSRDSGCDGFVDSVRVRFVFESDLIETETAGWMIRNIVIGQTALYGSLAETQYQPITIYPNPASDLIQIQLPSVNQKATETRIYDVMGKLMKSLPFSRIQDVSFLPTGNYILVVETEEGLFRSVLQKN